MSVISAFPCTSCELHERAKVVCAAPLGGNHPKFAVVVDHPNRWDEVTIGALWDALEDAGLRWQEGHITYAVRCSTMESIKKKHLNACNVYLEAELSWLAHETECKVILAVGTPAFHALGGRGPITNAQGSPYKYEGFFVVPIVHPSAAARSPQRMSEFHRAVQSFASLVLGKDGGTRTEVVLVNASN